MMVGETRMERGRRGFKRAAQKAKQSSESCLAGTVMSFFDQARVETPPNPRISIESPANHMPVTFWTPDGKCHEGRTPRLDGEVVFVESKLGVPLGADITIRLIEGDPDSAKWNLAEGTVVWRCPSGDLFKNGEGFGVHLQSRWPRPYDPDDGDELKGAA